MRLQCLSGALPARHFMPLEVIGMEARWQRVLPVWTGSLLAALGFLEFVVSYFLLPVYVITPCCGQTAYAPTAWVYSQNALSHFTISPVANTGLLLLCYLPLLAAVTVVGCLLGFLVWPHQAFVTWSYRVWLAGSVALVLLLLVVLFGVVFFSGEPEKGFFGLLLGYGLLWVGDRVVRNSALSA